MAFGLPHKDPNRFRGHPVETESAVGGGEDSASPPVEDHFCVRHRHAVEGVNHPAGEDTDTGGRRGDDRWRGGAEGLGGRSGVRVGLGRLRCWCGARRDGQ